MASLNYIFRESQLRKCDSVKLLERNISITYLKKVLLCRFSNFLFWDKNILSLLT